MMAAVACFGLTLHSVIWLTEQHPIDLIVSLIAGHDTVYSKGYSEARFKRIRVGMTPDQVVALIGQPLAKHRTNTWNRDEIWMFSDQRTGTDNFWCRLVVIEAGKVSGIESSFMVD
jgi:hypothetical protein